jgi:hypothetical protein
VRGRVDAILTEEQRAQVEQIRTRAQRLGARRSGLAPGARRGVAPGGPRGVGPGGFGPAGPRGRRGGGGFGL